ncbi:hypothetical protein [Actinomycetospora chiangmaiensis]|uniref:hypothetical protein n=1 Tax=Actinomycetospora chiangmaiensis TaxID=402650 RepID=UPI00036C9DE6|nr:hypothetical protein [Actinomycetospora chiangmaiensis]
MPSTEDQVLYARLLTAIGEGGVVEQTADGVVIDAFEDNSLMQLMHLRVTPASFGPLLRSTAGRSASAFPDVEPLEAAWQLFLVHLDAAIQTAAPGETELVPTPDGVGSFRPDLTRVPRTPEQEDQWINQQRYDRLIQHFADRGGVEVHLEAQTLVLRELDGQELPRPVRVRLPFRALSDRFRRADDPDSAVDGLIRELETEIGAGRTDMEVRADGSIHVGK